MTVFNQTDGREGVFTGGKSTSGDTTITTGGLKFGTSAGGVDVCAAVAVAGNVLTFITDALLLKRIFSTSASQQLFFDAVTLWNGASVDVTVVYKQI